MKKLSTKTKNLLITGIPALFIIFSAFGKLAAAPPVVEGLTKHGMGSYIQVLGIAELAFAVLFVLPKTYKLGFILLSCYFAGAIATDLSHEGPIIAPTILLIIVWVAAWFRDNRIFLPTTLA